MFTIEYVRNDGVSGGLVADRYVCEEGGRLEAIFKEGRKILKIDVRIKPESLMVNGRRVFGLVGCGE